MLVAFIVACVAAVALGVVLALVVRGASGTRAEAVRLEAEAAAARASAQELRDAQDELESKIELLGSRAGELESENARLSTSLQEIKRAGEQRLSDVQEHFDELRRTEREQLEEFKKNLHETFDASARRALASSHDEFLKRAAQTFEQSREKSSSEIKQHVTPIAETLKKADEKIAQLERQRLEAYAKLTEQIGHISVSHAELRDKTGDLVKALRKPQVRGQYGEIQLQRVAELAGMTSYCDFSTQASSRDSEGRLLRPDMVVKLPNGRAIAVDAKTNIEAYLDAIESDDEESRTANLDRFARHVREQAKALAGKNYWSQVDGGFDFVVMFIPGDQFIDAALEREERLLDLAAQDGVILASPSTLIGLLRAVAVGWREKSLSESAAELFELGKELHERAAVALGHASGVGKALETAQRKYNDFVGSVDSRLMPTLKKFEEKGAGSTKQLDSLSQIDGSPRRLAGDVQAGPDASAPEPEIVVRDSGEAQLPLEPDAS